MLALGVGGVDHKLAIDTTNADRGDRLLERDVGDAEGGGGTVDGEDVGIDLAVCGEQDADDLGVVEVILGEERAERTIRHAGGQDLLLARTSFALEVTAGELADGGGLLLVIDGQGKEVLAFLDGGGGNGADKHDGLAGSNDDGTVGELGDLAGLDGDGILADIGRDFNV